MVSKTTTWYKVTTHATKVDPVPVTRETEHGIYIDVGTGVGRLHKKATYSERYYPTYEEAYANLLANAEAKVKNAKENLHRAEETLRKVRQSHQAGRC